jgi:hypothetical protein
MTETTEKRSKKLAKEIEGEMIKITALGGSKGEMVFLFSDLPADIQAKLGPFGLGHKLGDAAAGKEGLEAEEAINKVFDGLKSGDWSVKAPQGPRVSIKALAENVSKLDPASQEAAKALLTSLGVKIPGFNE